MKILHIIQKLVPGGGQRALFNIVKENTSMYHYVLTYICTEEYKILFQNLKNAQLIIMNSLMDYRRSLAKLEYDVVNYHWWPGLHVYGDFFERRKRPVILTLQEQCEPPIYKEFFYVAGSRSNLNYLSKISENRKSENTRSVL